MSVKHAIEDALVGAAFAASRVLPWGASLALGAAAGDAARLLGLRVRVARENLALAFPEKPTAEREAILRACMREVGRIAIEYSRIAQLVDAPDDVTFARLDIERVARPLVGRGAIFVTGHYGNMEMFAARMGRMNPMVLLVKPQSNVRVSERIVAMRRAAHVEVVPTTGGVKQIFKALRSGRWVAMAADQDARRHGVFVPFFGRLASTPEGPARLALQTGSPLVFGHIRRGPDGRHEASLDEVREVSGEANEDNVRALVAWYTSRLEQVIRERPEHWFWLHRRWKTAPPAGAHEG